MKLRKLFLIFLVIALSVGALVLSASAAGTVASGKCGDNLTWMLDSDKVLTISGTGDMYDFEHDGIYPADTNVPWFQNRFKIETVVIEEGVTSIGNWAFARCGLVNSVSVPASVTKIGTGAFAFNPANWDGAYSNGEEYNYLVIFQGARPYFTEETFHTDWEDEGYEYNTVGIRCLYPKQLWEEPSGYGVTWIAQDDISTGLNGPCGKETYWHLDYDGNLTISGTGGIHYITDYAMWHYVNIPVKRIVIESGVTGFGWLAFAGSAVTEVVLPKTLQVIGEESFANCKQLTEITIPASVKTIHGAAFSGCSNLQTIIFQGDAPEFSLGYDDKRVQFNGVTATAIYPEGNTTWTSNKMKNYGGKITWVENKPLAITTQPKTSYIKMGGDVVMPVVAEGVGLTYQWYELAPGETEFKKSDNTTDTYQTVMSPETKDRMVRCVITDYYGNTVQSNKVTMRCAATITKQPADVKVKSGTTAKVSVSAVGDGLTYTWYQAAPGVSTFSKSSITSSTYTMEMTAARSGRRVYCVVKDKYGKTHKSQIATLTMANPVAITTQPKTVYAKQGQPATVTVETTGDGLTYQWYIKNKGASKFSLTKTITGNSYSISSMDATRNGRQIYCVVTDQYGNSVKSNTVFLRMAATITEQPKTTSVAEGETAKITLKAVGDGLKYQWYYKNKGASKFSLTKTFTGPSYTISAMDASRNGRQVYCVVTDQYGKSVQSDTVTLALSVKITAQPKTTYTQQGETARVSVSATGDGLCYQWYIKNEGASGYSKSSVTKPTYSVTMNSKVKNRRVLCIVKDQYGNSVQSKSVILRMAATITDQPDSVMVAKGKTAKVSLKAVGDGLTYKWYYKDAGASKFLLTKTFTGNTYSAPMSAARDGRQIYCVVTDQYGNSVKSAVVTLNME